MRGKSTLYLPGLDHAGIATQAVVEKHLGIGSRVALGRSKFVQEIFNWCDKYSSRIKTQISKMGVSVDWTSEVFTLDKKRSDAVNYAFTLLYDKNLIFRDKKIVNWCPFLNTVLSDIEVDHMEITKKRKIQIPIRDPNQTSKKGYREVEVGSIWRIAYPIYDQQTNNKIGEIEVETTRPETI
eukprot:TRINITY_DN3362_c0_g1_i1.p1 TRINITY_DN3362_c0_g1~~TRINITY_DN3362_c0_g1_i1.p1  ORF type:complete len:182 (+),score=24.64 TRINITY_DN3362_c0_g1_i1:383-928(+)